MHVPWWATIAIVIVAVLAFAHARRYFRAFNDSSDSITILQASLEDATSDVLGEWRPLVIQDRLVEPENALASTLLRWQYVWKSGVQPVEYGQSYRSLCRFTAIFPSSEYDTRILLSRDNNDDVEVVLSMGRCIILPPGFTYSVKKGEFQASQVRFHDSVTGLLFRFVK